MLRDSAGHQKRLTLCLWFVVSVALSFHAAAGSAQVKDTQSGALENFRRWLDLARQHVPAEVDGPVREVRAYSLNRFAELRGDLEAFIQFLNDPRLTRLVKSNRYTVQELLALRQIAVTELGAGTAARLLRRIALLHTDAATLPGAVPYVIGGESSTPPDVILGVDGVSTGRARTTPHLPTARAALAGLQPGPAEDAWARLWYRATAAFLLYDAQLANLAPHFNDWRVAIPDDPAAVFAAACLNEAYSSDLIQRAVVAEVVRGGATIVPDAREALTRARLLFSRLVPTDADYPEARVRLGRVLWRLGEARAAADELSNWLTASSRDIQYLAHLFLGAAQWTLGNVAVSASAYEEAQRLYPTAQAPAVALLLVKPEAADVDSTAVRVLKSAEAERTDPWFHYKIGPGRHVHTLMATLWQSPDIR